MISSIKNRQIQSILKALLLPNPEQNFQNSYKEKKFLGIYKETEKNVPKQSYDF